jgi:hypothetical protein
LTATAFVCVTCGVQRPPSAAAPARCPICEDERQYVRQGGQSWTTIPELAGRGHRIVFREQEPGLLGIGVEPAIGIGQRALLVQTPQGNFLWDCVGFIDEAALERVRGLGGLAGISMSHPHFYGAVVEWSRSFGGVPIHIPSADREWVAYPDPAVALWEGTREVLPGLTLVQCGGHFEGSAVLHWAAGANGAGALLVGDTITVVPDIRYVSFMRSYPNLIPLPAEAVTRIVDAVAPYPFERVYGGWWDRVVRGGGRSAVTKSASRYLRWIGARR